MTVRRVVTGRSAHGTSTVVVDGRLEQTVAGPVGLELVWRSDEVPSVPNDGVVDAALSFPPAGGAFVLMWQLAAYSTADVSSGEVEMHTRRPGFHATDTVDVNVVMSGRVVLDLDETSVELDTYDTVVVNGELHAWRNPYPEPARILTTVVGARRSP